MNAKAHYEVEQSIRTLINEAGGLNSFLDSLGVVLYNENSDAPAGGLCPCITIAELIEAAGKRAAEVAEGIPAAASNCLAESSLLKEAEDGA